MLTSVNNSSAVSLNTCARASRVTSAAEYRRQFTSTDGFDTCVCGVVCALSSKFSPLSVSGRYYIIQYRRKKIRFRAVAANCFAAILRLCCGQFICMHLQNDLYCVEWGVKLYSLTHSRVPGISVCILSCKCTV